MNDVNVDSGFHLFYRTNQDLLQVKHLATKQQTFQDAVQNNLDCPRLPMYLVKKLVGGGALRQASFLRVLLLVYVCAWQTRRNHQMSPTPLLFLEQVPWLDSIAPFAEDQGIGIVPVRRSEPAGRLFRRLLPGNLKNVLRVLRYRGFRGTKSLLRRNRIERSDHRHPSSDMKSSDANPKVRQNKNYRIATEYVGLLNLNYPERASNLFFLEDSSLDGSDLTVTFTASNVPLDQPTQSELSEHGVSAVVTHYGATTLANVPVFSSPRSVQKPKLNINGQGSESKWIEQQVSEYHEIREYWTALFKAYDIRIYVNYNKSESAYFARADAMESLGGVTVNYERTHNSYPRLDLVGSADIMFNFSRISADLEIESGSTARYHVITGYLGDHRFPLLRETAQEIRDALCQRGAKRILAFFDENSVEDARWNSIDHQLVQDNYAFLLDKVIAEPWFGLVIKPKVPNTLRSRLGEVADLLEQAEATGRCYLFEAGGIQGWYSPAAAALAADVAVHGHLRTSAAGLEAALSGVPTLLMEREGWKTDPLYRLGVGQVVFKSWENLWDTCTRNWGKTEGVPGFGDWSSILDELDPFRDGRSAERMGDYLKWVLDGIRSGLDRQTAMSDAAQRYRGVWGYDKVVSVNT